MQLPSDARLAPYAEANRGRIVATLVEWLRIPSVSAHPDRATDVQASAEFTAALMRSAGLDNVAIIPTQGAPAVYGDWLHAAAGAPTVVVYGHHDVQPVDPVDLWHTPPFAPDFRDGQCFARGAIDDKDIVAAGLMVMLLLERSHARLHRDVIFIAEAGEEGTPHVGIDFLIDRHWNEIAAEYALAEGGAAVSRNGKVRYVAVATAEKVPRGVTLIARGVSGHASRPSPDNAIVRLAQAVARLGAWRTPMRLDETTRAYFARLAAISSPEDADRYRRLLDPSQATEVDRYLERYELAHYALLHTTLAPTILKAGFARNVIPAEAEAYLDIRALPGEDVPRLYEEMRAAIAGLDVEIVTHKPDRPATPPSRIDTALYRALEHAQEKLFPGAVTLPSMLTGATDLAQLRARGVQSYGIGPVVEAGDRGEAHGDDERIREASLFKLVEFLWYAILGA